MQIFLVTDIIGITEWLLQLEQAWLHQGHRVTVVSPYAEQNEFETETKAYETFTNLGGFDSYCNKLTRKLSEGLTDDISIYIGFSAGGAALWRCLKNNVKPNSHLVAFYPGQIRHHLDIEPSLDTTIVFPQSEKHFDLTKVIEHLVTKSKLKIIQNDQQHGYANPSSKNYNKNASDELLALLSEPDNLTTSSQLSAKVFQLQNEHKAI